MFLNDFQNHRKIKHIQHDVTKIKAIAELLNSIDIDTF